MRRWLGRLGWMAIGALLLLAAVVAFHIRSRPPLRPWHRVRLREEFAWRAGSAIRRLPDYLALEERLFSELERELLARVDLFPALSRFDRSSPTHPGRLPGNWNHSVTLGPDRSARGGALLLHGLSDAPYSLRAVGRAARAGRLRRRRAARERAEQAAPLVIVGYSNGAALALDFTLDALNDRSCPIPPGWCSSHRPSRSAGQRAWPDSWPRHRGSLASGPSRGTPSCRSTIRTSTTPSRPAPPPRSTG